MYVYVRIYVNKLIKFQIVHSHPSASRSHSAMDIQYSFHIKAYTNGNGEVSDLFTVLYINRYKGIFMKSCFYKFMC